MTLSDTKARLSYQVIKQIGWDDFKLIESYLDQALDAAAQVPPARRVTLPGEPELDWPFNEQKRISLR